MKIKHTEASQGLFLRAADQSPIGKVGDAYVLEITDIPEKTPHDQVLRLANQTTFLAAKHDGSGRYSYRFEELGEGKIIRA